jgi:hypothetical protein
MKQSPVPGSGRKSLDKGKSPIYSIKVPRELFDRLRALGAMRVREILDKFARPP